MAIHGLSRLAVHVGYGATSFASAALHNLFITYYIQLFLSVYEVDLWWFYVGQTVYLVWNSVNDPLFGWLLHSSSLLHRDTPHERVSRICRFIEYGGYLWVLSLWLIFLPSTPSERGPASLPASPLLTGLHFALAICFYDGMLSMVMLAHGALMADLTLLDSERASLNSSSAVGSLVGSLSLALSHVFWDRHNLSSFRTYIYCVGVLAAIAFRVTGSLFSRLSPSSTDSISSSFDSKKGHGHTPSLWTDLSRHWRQLLDHRNFWLFVASVWVQVLNCHFNNNFMAVFVDLFIPAGLSFVKSSLLSLGGFLPHFTVILCSRLLKAPTAGLSVYGLLSALYRLKFLLAVAALLVFWACGSQPSWVFYACLIVAFKVSNETVCRHGSLVLSDIVDEDVVKNSRPVSSSTFIFGANALFTKSAQSFAPMLTWPFLVHTGSDPEPAFYLLVLTPLVISLIQMAIWRTFTLHSTYLTRIKSIRDTLGEEAAP